MAKPPEPTQPIEVTLAEQWAHDNLIESAYADDNKRGIAVSAYCAGFRANEYGDTDAPNPAPAADGRDIAVWQFNEAVSLLREARAHLGGYPISREIDEGLPAIQAALETAAALQRDPTGALTDLHEELAMANARLKEAEALLRRWMTLRYSSMTRDTEILHAETEAWL